MQSSVLHVSIGSAGYVASDASSRRLTGSDKPASVKVVLQNNSPLEVLNATAAKSFELSCSKNRESSLNETCLYPQVVYVCVCMYVCIYIRTFNVSLYLEFLRAMSSICTVTDLQQVY